MQWPDLSIQFFIFGFRKRPGHRRVLLLWTYRIEGFRDSLHFNVIETETSQSHQVSWKNQIPLEVCNITVMNWMKTLKIGLAIYQLSPRFISALVSKSASSLKFFKSIKFKIQISLFIFSSIFPIRIKTSKNISHILSKEALSHFRKTQT